MGKPVPLSSLLLFLVLVVLCYALLNTASGFGDEGGRRRGRGGGGGGGRDQMEEGGEWEGGGEVVQGEDWFLLRGSVPVMQTHAGYMRVLKGVGIKPLWRSSMHIGFITMEPQSLFTPQYLDSSIILFIRKGEARIGHIYKDELAERKVKTGDIYRIAAGSAFYIVNTAEGQRLQIICSIATTTEPQQSTGFQSFFVGGGLYSILAGFDSFTMAAALNVTVEELKELVSSEKADPIVYLSNTTQTPSLWSKFLDLEQHQRLSHLKRIVFSQEKSDPDEEEESRWSWSWRNLLLSFFGDENKKERERKTRKGPDSYNIYDRKPDFKNDYGWSIALDESDYHPLGDSDIGVYLVNLTAGSMMAPHINPKATEIGIVLEGNGTIQIVFPNGTLAMNAKVSAGDVFWVPRFFPFCQIASRTAPFEFFGFTTSSKKNWPVFLVGQNSLLQLLRGPELAAALGWSEERLENITGAQKQSAIFPSQYAAEPKVEGRGEMKIPKIINNFEDEIIMGF